MCNHYLSLFLVYYRFDRSNIGIDTSVSTVYGECGRFDIHCGLKSTVTENELRVTKSLGNEPLNYNSHCVVNFVEIIHDCIPRRVPLKLYFKSGFFGQNLYLKV